MGHLEHCMAPFILLAYMRVKKGYEKEYLKYAKKVDAKVGKTEPGMLYHSLDKDTSRPGYYTWTEVYADDAALLAHFNNPAVAEHAAESKHTWQGGQSIHVL